MKLIKLGALIKRSAKKSNERNTERIFGEKDKADKLSAIFVIIPAGISGPKLHYHTERESWILILSGEGKEVVDGKEFSLKAKDSIFILPYEKHKILNTGKTELKYLEIYTVPSDTITVE